MRRRDLLIGMSSLALAGPAPAEGRVTFIDTHLHPLRNGREGSVSSAVSTALREMDRFGIEKAILLPPPFPEPDERTYGLRELKAAVRGQSRLAFTAGGESLNP